MRNQDGEGATATLGAQLCAVGFVLLLVAGLLAGVWGVVRFVMGWF
jgi:hypothetical protein